MRKVATCNSFSKKKRWGYLILMGGSDDIREENIMVHQVK